jgi:hypothetical protein
VFLHKDDLALWEAGEVRPTLVLILTRKPDRPISSNMGNNYVLGIKLLKYAILPVTLPDTVIFYWAEQQSVFCGDLIFYHGVGRTDLAYSDAQALIQSIHENVFHSPEETKLLSGHGRPTRCGKKRIKILSFSHSS